MLGIHLQPRRVLVTGEDEWPIRMTMMEKKKKKRKNKNRIETKVDSKNDSMFNSLHIW